MTHRLRQRHPLQVVGNNPMIASIRYRCECATNEVLQIQVVLDVNCNEERFLWTMKQLWKDVQFEVEQHINPPERLNQQPASSSSSPRSEDKR